MTLRPTCSEAKLSPLVIPGQKKTDLLSTLVESLKEEARRSRANEAPTDGGTWKR